MKRAAEQRLSATHDGSEYGVRRAKVVETLSDLKLDVAIVVARANVRYLSGFTGSNGALLLGPEIATLFTDPRYQFQARHETSCRVRIARGSLLSPVVQTIRRNRWRRVGFETRRIDYASYQLLKEHLPVACALEPLGDTIEQQRMVKSLSEIELIRASVQTNSKAFQLAVRNLKPGMREYELAAELDYQMRRLGAERPAFDTIVASGHRTALPHAQPTEARLENDQLVLVDMGATQAGYASDMTRMLHLGRPAARVRRLYAAVLEAQMAALAEVCEGATAGGVDRKARQTMRAHGLEKAFLHSTGHGVGLEIHEPPRLGKKDKTRLRSGMVVTIEPGAYLEGFGGVRIEDTVLVTEYGCEVLTPTAKDLLLI